MPQSDSHSVRLAFTQYGQVYISQGVPNCESPCYQLHTKTHTQLVDLTHHLPQPLPAGGNHGTARAPRPPGTASLLLAPAARRLTLPLPPLRLLLLLRLLPFVAVLLPWTLAVLPCPCRHVCQAVRCQGPPQLGDHGGHLQHVQHSAGVSMRQPVRQVVRYAVRQAV